MSNPITSTKAFKDALDKFIHIGNAYYNSKHHDNVLNIFNDMEKNDRLVLLQGVYHIYAIFEFGVENPQVAAIIPVSKPELDEDEDGETTESLNQKAMLELKVWFAKMVLVFFVVAILIFIFFVVTFSDSAENGSSILSQTFKIFALMFGK